MVEQGVAPTRQKAQALILTGNVRVDGEAVSKASYQAEENCSITVSEAGQKFVSRGGLKARKSVCKSFRSIRKHAVWRGHRCVAPADLPTACCRRARKKCFRRPWDTVSLTGNCETIRASGSVMERTNARFIKPEDFGESFDFVGVDASFISLKLLLSPMRACMKDTAHAVVLIKPQFEAGKGFVGKNGVVRDADVHEQVVRSIVEFVPTVGFAAAGLDFSPITGPKGNIEFLLYLSCDAAEAAEFDVRAVVDAAHRSHGM